eukprot:jgi/Mesvir1/20101/Mv13342-RA.2
MTRQMTTSEEAKTQCLKYLESQGITVECHTHPVVLTVEEQAKHVGQLPGGHSKNLFLKDRKGRFILVTALPATKVDMRVLSQRLGLGKSGIRMAPPEDMQQLLQVPLGCVTPLAVLRETAKDVVLLLDKGYLAHEVLYFHPLTNDATIAIKRTDLDKFLQSLGRTPAYVELDIPTEEGKDVAADLAGMFQASDGASGGATAPGGAAKPAAATPAKAGGKENKKEAKADAGTVLKVRSGPAPDDVSALTERVMLMCASALASSTGGDATTALTLQVRETLVPNLQHVLTMFKNAAYVHGYEAAKQGVMKQSVIN